jgi:alpha-glucosidase (family GH31 glycosyl hydrolase)
MALMVDATFDRAAQIYGVPLHASSLALKATAGSEPYRMYNLDVFEYEIDNTMALYGAVPFIMSHTRDAAAGLFWLNAAEMFVDVDIDEVPPFVLLVTATHIFDTGRADQAVWRGRGALAASPLLRVSRRD